MSAFGVRNEYGNLERVLVHRPGAELDVVNASNLREFNFSAPVDRAKFATDWDAMTQRFREDGVEPLFLDEVLAGDADSLATIRRRPNLTYVRDLAAVFTTGAVLMGPHLKGRWGDQWIVGRALRRLGIPILGAIEPPGFLEGGGVTRIGDDTVVASLCDRANECGTRALRDLVLGREAKYFLEVPLPYGHIHIDGLFMVLDADLCLIHEEPFRTFPCRLWEAGRAEPRHPTFEEFLDARGFRRLAISESESRAGHLNVVVTRRSRRAVGFESASRVRSEMRRLGFELSGFPANELILGNGGPHCMTCPVLVS
jgi:N-dimethylarginine dimethylaminohydrolase